MLGAPRKANALEDAFKLHVPDFVRYDEETKMKNL